MPVPTLYGQRLTLRASIAADALDRLAAGRDPEYVRMCGGDPSALAPLTPEEASAWYEHQRDEPYAWSVVSGNHCIGSARLHHLDGENRRARYAIGIFDAASRGLGYGTETTRLMLRYAFEQLALHRVDLRVLAYNAPAIACYTACGFVREGLEREGALIAGAWQSDVWMSILEQEYWAIVPSWHGTWGRESTGD
jgi:RimJ/RimL family protein N-acetyltransferase